MLSQSLKTYLIRSNYLSEVFYTPVMWRFSLEEDLFGIDHSFIFLQLFNRKPTGFPIGTSIGVYLKIGFLDCYHLALLDDRVIL